MRRAGAPKPEQLKTESAERSSTKQAHGRLQRLCADKKVSLFSSVPFCVLGAFFEALGVSWGLLGPPGGAMHACMHACVHARMHACMHLGPLLGASSFFDRFWGRFWTQKVPQKCPKTEPKTTQNRCQNLRRKKMLFRSLLGASWGDLGSFWVVSGTQKC